MINSCKLIKSTEDDYTWYLQVDNIRVIYDDRVQRFIGWYIYA